MTVNTIFEQTSRLKDKSIEGLMNYFNWEVEKLPLVIAENMQETSTVATVRRLDNGKLVVFSDKVDTGYEPIQNLDLILGVVKPFIDADCTIESAGTYNQGQRIWIKGKFNGDDIIVKPRDQRKPGDLISRHWIVSDDRTAKHAATVGIMAVRLRCTNGQTITEKDLVRVHHSRDGLSNMIDLAECLSKAGNGFTAYGERLNRLATADINQADFDRLITRVHSPNWDRLMAVASLPTATTNEKEKFEKEQERILKIKVQINNIFQSERSITEDGAANNTAYGAYEALNFFENHGGDASESRVHSLAFGAGRTRDYNALKYTEELVLARR